MWQHVGVVLAGGSGQRLGVAKGEFVVGGLNMAERAARELASVCGTVLISVPPGGRNPAPDHDAVEDEPPAGRGPLAGILAAFAHTERADLLVLACDYPRVEGPLLEAIARHASIGDDMVIPTDPRGRDHPLVGLWRRGVERHVRDMLDRRIYKVRALLGDVRVHRVRPADVEGIDLGRSLLNVNTPDDLAELRENEPPPL